MDIPVSWAVWDSDSSSDRPSPCPTACRTLQPERPQEDMLQRAPLPGISPTERLPMATGKKEGARTGQTHAYVQFILFCSIMTGLNLHPDGQVAGSGRETPKSHGTRPSEVIASSESVSTDPVPVAVSEYPANMVYWGEEGRPLPEDSGQFEIWDISNSSTRKIVTLSDLGKGHSERAAIPDATVFLEPGGRVRFPLTNGQYSIVALAGSDWNGHDFGKDGVAVSYRPRSVHNDQITVLVIGAPDEPVTRIEGKST